MGWKKTARNVLGLSQKKRLNKSTLKIVPDDVFLVSFPRSGNTWLRHMLVLLHPGVPAGVARDIHRDIPSLDAKAERMPRIHEIPRPRLIKSHGVYDPDLPRVIYLLRDGRDAAASLFRFSQKESRYRGSFREFLEQGAKYKGLTWSEHVTSWLFQSHSTPLLLLRYEEVLGYPEREVSRAVEFLHWDVSLEQIRQAVVESSIERMRQREDDGKFLAHVGEGKTGTWRERYSDQELRIFLSYSADPLRRLEYLD